MFKNHYIVKLCFLLFTSFCFAPQEGMVEVSISGFAGLLCAFEANKDVSEITDRGLGILEKERGWNQVVQLFLDDEPFCKLPPDMGDELNLTAIQKKRTLTLEPYRYRSENKSVPPLNDTCIRVIFDFFHNLT